MEQEKKNQNQPAAQEPSVGDQIKVRREKLASLQAEGRNPFEITKFVQTTNSAEIKAHFDEMEGKPVSIAGRLMSKRGMGKVSFCDLQDKEGRIQLYARKDEMDEEEYNRFKKYDIGDIVGIEGEVFRTQRGEMSVRAKKITLLSKSLLPLPEKFHGLTDKETRYRQRYVDLIVNPEVKRNFIIRSQFIKHLRDYLDNMGYIEVETPVLNTIAGGAAARPFITHHNTLDIDMYMRIATELPLKRLIVGGMDRVYEVGRIFRNEGMDPKHNPEFTTVELYQAYADFHDMMDIAEGVYTTFAQKYLGTYELEWMGEKVDLTPGWPRLTMIEAVKKYVGIDFGAISDDAEAVAAAKAVGGELAEAAEKCTVFGRVTPEQKRQLVHALQAKGHTVAMTGDGVNDLLALREADCSIAISEGSDASRQIAQIVLLDSDFTHLPQVVLEGRRVINNVTRTAGVFFIKTIYSVLLSFICLFCNIPFPFIPIQITLVDAFVEAWPSFAAVFETDTRPVHGSFLKKAFGRAWRWVSHWKLPGSVCRSHLPPWRTGSLCMYCCLQSP